MNRPLDRSSDGARAQRQISTPAFEDVLGTAAAVGATRLFAPGPAGKLPLTEEMLRQEPSGNLFGLTQNVGMGWDPATAAGPQYLILSTQGGLRAEDGSPIALGYHTGHWEVGLLVRRAAETLREQGVVPFAAYCSDPCDGRSQGTTGMFDSLPYRNDAAQVMRRLIRSLPTCAGVMGVATCDKGLPATMLALAGSRELPGIIVPGGVTLPALDAEDAGQVQSLGARFAHGLVSLEYAATMACRACGSPGGGCQFLGTAATAQVVAEALGLALPHTALAPSGEPIWLEAAHRSALALLRLSSVGLPLSAILSDRAVENAMLVHAAFGGSTNLLLHLPAIAHAAGLRRPTVEDWSRVNRATPRLVDVLPNGPRHHPTVQVFMAGGVPEVMLHLRRMGLLHLDVRTVTGETLGAVLDWWEESERRRAVRARLREATGVDPDHVIMDPDAARRAGLTSTVVFPVGNLAPEGSVIKATAIDPSVVGEDQVYRHRGPARVFVDEREAIRAVKGETDQPIRPGDVLVLIGGGPSGTGMQEIAQITSALRYIPWGKHVAVLTDARFSGFSTGACIGHIGQEALAGGPIGKLRDGDVIQIVIDRRNLTGSIDLVGTSEGPLTPEEAHELLRRRPPFPGLAPHPRLPDDTRLWAALQRASGGPWAGCVYDVDRIVQVIEAGLASLAASEPRPRPGGAETSEPPSRPEVWLRGPIEGISPALQPVAHALLQALEDIERIAPSLSHDELWAMPGGAASIGFHLRHIAGTLDRLLTYARGESLSERQREALAAEKTVTREVGAGELLELCRAAIARAMDQVRSTPDDSLDEPRAVGRAALPSTVRGLLFHAAEHTTRHVGQIITTLKVLRGRGA
jgi:putative YjhG/YagF family dehydratase